MIAFALAACGQSGSPPGGAPAAGAGSSGAGAPSAGTTDAGGASGSSETDAGSGGASGSSETDAGSGGAAGGGSPATTVDVSGEWAMFTFADPVAVSLRQDGTVLSGTGCCGGLNPAVDFCCSPIAGGSIIGRNVKFAFPIDIAGGPYAADVFVSADGSRMAGAFHNVVGWGPPMAWVRIASGEPWLPETSGELANVVEPRAATFALTLNGVESVLGFSPDATYSFGLVYDLRAMVYGDLGSFWEGELSWNEAEQTLTAGPVPETHPELPTELRLRFEDTLLLEVGATFPSLETASFSAEPQ